MGDSKPHLIVFGSPPQCGQSRARSLARSLMVIMESAAAPVGRPTARRDVVVVVVVCRYDASELALSGARAIARADALMQ